MFVLNFVYLDISNGVAALFFTATVFNNKGNVFIRMFPFPLVFSFLYFLVCILWFSFFALFALVNFSLRLRKESEPFIFRFHLNSYFSVALILAFTCFDFSVRRVGLHSFVSSHIFYRKFFRKRLVPSDESALKWSK